MNSKDRFGHILKIILILISVVAIVGYYYGYEIFLRSQLMKKFDRAILIFIGLGIWALAMTQVFKPSSAVAVGGSCGTEDNPCIITTPSFGFGRSLPLPVTINNSFMNAVPIRT